MATVSDLQLHGVARQQHSTFGNLLSEQALWLPTAWNTWP